MKTVHSSTCCGNSCSGNSSLQNQIFDNYSTQGNAKLSGIVCTNSLDCSGSTQILGSRIHKMRVSGSTQLSQSTVGDVTASGSFQASDCPKLGKVLASGATYLSQCDEIDAVVASGGFSLDSSKVKGDVVLSGNDALIVDSAINGTLQCAEKIVHVSQWVIGRIVVKPVKDSFSFEFFSFGWKRSTSPEQVIELSGKNCRVGPISFEDGAFGKVLLKDGATVTSVTGGKIVPS